MVFVTYLLSSIDLYNKLTKLSLTYMLIAKIIPDCNWILLIACGKYFFHFSYLANSVEYVVLYWRFSVAVGAFL